MAAKAIPVQTTLKEYGRGITGGLLFSLPMLYTMEMWWAGFILKPFQLLIYLIVGFFLLYVYNKYAGLSASDNFGQNILESFEEMGMALLLTSGILFLTGRIHTDMAWNDVFGKIIVETVTVAIGISVGQKQLGTDEEAENHAERREHSIFWRSILLALCGAILVASNIAPTDEVAVIGLEAEVSRIFLIALFSIGIGGAVLYYINFKGTVKRGLSSRSYKEVIFGTMLMYAISLSVSAFMLWFFGRFHGLSLSGMISQIVVLAFPASLGASAGRFLIQD